MRVRLLLLAGIALVLATSTLPAAIAGAKEGVGSFRVTCAPSHDGFFDPIVFPNQVPAGHQHEFYGSISTSPSSGPGSLIGTSTTCSDAADSSGYWHPTAFFNGVRAPATIASIYYTQRTTRKPIVDLQAWPAGLRVIAGEMHAASAQSDFIVWWDCDGSTVGRQPTAPTCPTSSRGLEVSARFPDCWDGVNLDSADHKSHMSYSMEDASGVFRCDAAHPVALPYVNMIVRWDGQYPAGDSVTLASGAAFTFHADFMNGWDQARLVSLFDQCIKTQIECGRITSGTMASPVAATTPSAPTPTTLVPFVPTPAAPAANATVTTHAHAAVTTETTADAGAGHDHSSGAAAASSSTYVADTTLAGSSTVTTMIIASGPAASSLGQGARDTSTATGGFGNVGAVGAVIAVVVLGAGLWALASAGYSRLRKSPAPSRD
jgi:uncharacterized protein DUF1996